MKKLHLLLLLFTSLAFAQPPINTPDDYAECSDVGMTSFDLTVKIPEVLDLLAPNLYTVDFFETYMDALVYTNPIVNTTNYVNLIPNQQTLYIRVTENANPDNYSFTTLNLIVNALPIVGPVFDLFANDAPYDGVAAFDLTLNEIALVNGAADVYVSYFGSQAAAQSGTGVIITPTSYTGSNGQVMWARLENANGCYSITNFTLHVIDPANIVNIPDANFKAKLTGTNCADYNNDGVYDGDADFNNDGEIQYTEAQAVYRLQVNNTALPSPNSISSLTGIEAFTNLIDLNCMLNTLGTFNYSIPTLQKLVVGNNNLTSLNLTGMSNLISLDCDQNNLVSLDLTATPNLVSLGCDYNQITSLTIAGLTHLTGLSARYNNLTSLDLSQSAALTGLQVDGNVFPLVVSNLVNLQGLGCSYMGLTNIDLSNNVNLVNLSMNGNNFTSLTFPSLPLLHTLFCSEMPTLTSLNVNSCPSLGYFNCVNNANLTHLFMKNGVTAFSSLDLAENFNLQFLCVDDFNVDGLITNLNFLGITGVNVCSYCTVTPGGNYNTITGHVTFDANSNGCDATDISQPNIRVDINDGSTSGSAFNTAAGDYSFFTQAGYFTLTPNVENPAWFTISPQSDSVYYSDNNNNSTTKDFCIIPNGSHQDLEMVMAPLTPARPGFNAVYKLVYRNKGNTIMGPATSGIILVYNAAKLTYVSSSQPVTATGTSSINFTYPQLLPFASGSIEVTFHVNAPTDTPAVNIGDELQFMTMISPNNLDENIPDNTFNYTQTVVGSFDPNDITCMEGPVVSPSEIGKYLHYVINFENTGTYQAENIVVKEIVDTEMYDLNSLQVLNSSAAVTTKVTNNKAEFMFQNINLDSGGHGNILIKIKSKNTLVQGDSVAKKADIYFDYNFPITTNEATTVFQLLSNPSFPIDASVNLYPNPTHNIINIKATNTITSVQLFDAQGRLLQTKLVNENNTTLDITAQSAGVYFIKATTDKGIKVEKIVKQ
jgi:hypothetical protein